MRIFLKILAIVRLYVQKHELTQRTINQQNIFTAFFEKKINFNRKEPFLYMVLYIKMVFYESKKLIINE